jgi:hypothetical protein
MDPAYQAVDPSDFKSLVEVDRYGQRSDAFDKIIAATHDHFWDPLDTKYIDFTPPFDLTKEYLIDPAQDLEENPVGQSQCPLVALLHHAW